MIFLFSGILTTFTKLLNKRPFLLISGAFLAIYFGLTIEYQLLSLVGNEQYNVLFGDPIFNAKLLERAFSSIAIALLFAGVWKLFEREKSNQLRATTDHKRVRQNALKVFKTRLEETQEILKKHPDNHDANEAMDNLIKYILEFECEIVKLDRVLNDLS